jgi:hypothetical protein
MKNKRYPNLYTVAWTPNWVFRKYSREKHAQFTCSTGILATDRDAAAAYKKGIEKFDEWLGSILPAGKTVLVRDLGRSIRAGKQQRRDRTIRSFGNQLDNHVLPNFGHLRPDQVTARVWEEYDATERKRTYKDRNGRERRHTRLFNTRKALLEILNRAHEEGMIKRVPDLKNFDPPPAPPKHMTFQQYRAFRRRLQWPAKLLAFIMYWQGPRPTEAMAYAWDMLRQGDSQIDIPGEITKTGRSRTILLNSRVRRALRWLRKHATSRWLMPSEGTKSGHLENYNAVWVRARAALKLDFTIYNLRDTWITNSLKKGISSTFIGKYSDTSPTMIEGKYAVAEEEIMRRVAG